MHSGTKLGSNFQIKDKTKFDHKHDLVYYVKCPECQEDYIGEIGRRLHEWICDHSGKDSKPHMLKHSLENNHKKFLLKISVYFEMVTLTAKGKISEALFIKELRPSLNTQETCVRLLLYND